eukprot:6897988-Prymnesium_polylepis.1
MAPPQWMVTKLLSSSSPLQGGGMRIAGGSAVTATACTISGNAATGVSRFPKILEPLRNSPSPLCERSLGLKPPPSLRRTHREPCLPGAHKASAGGLQGGGIWAVAPSDLTLIFCSIANNTAGAQGTAVEYGPDVYSTATVCPWQSHIDLLYGSIPSCVAPPPNQPTLPPSSPPLPPPPPLIASDLPRLYDALDNPKVDHVRLDSGT